MDETYMTIPAICFSILITVFNTVIAIYLVYFFCLKETKISNYLKFTVVMTVIFNALNSFFNTLYCLYLTWSPEVDDKMFYIHHESHIQRIISTSSWYIAKVLLIYVLSGRLYISFLGSMYAVNKRFIIAINTMNTIIAPIDLIPAYWYVYHGNLVFAEIAFNFWRILYQLMVLIILCMFTKRLLILSPQCRTSISSGINNKKHSDTTDINPNKTDIVPNKSQSEISTKTKTESDAKSEKSSSTNKPISTISSIQIEMSLSLIKDSQVNTPQITPDIAMDIDPDITIIYPYQAANAANAANAATTKDDTLNVPPKPVLSPRASSNRIHEPRNSSFLALAVRNSILTSVISLTVFMVTISSFGFRFMFGSQTRLTLLIPMNMASFDSFITSICIFCLFRCGEKLYYKICGKCDILCKQICPKIGAKFC